MDFWLDKTSDKGVSFGTSSIGSDLHRTRWGSEGKIRYHIRHKGIKEPPDESPVGRQTSIRLVSGKIEKMVKKRLAIYRANKTCWVFTQKRWERIRSLLPNVDSEGNTHVPLELIFSRLDMDFSNKNLWRKVRAQSLLMDEPRFGFIESKRGTVRLVTPISKNQMLAWPLARATGIQEYVFGVMGLGEFIEYVAQTDEGKKLMSGVKKQLNRLINS